MILLPRFLPLMILNDSSVNVLIFHQIGAIGKIVQTNKGSNLFEAKNWEPPKQKRVTTIQEALSAITLFSLRDTNS